MSSSGFKEMGKSPKILKNDDQSWIQRPVSPNEFGCGGTNGNQ